MEGTIFWKIPKYKVSAEEAYKEISQLEEITPQNIVDLARNENSKIHNEFEWNDEIAGEKYRNIQAQEMIRLFVIKPKSEEAEPTRVLQITTQTGVYEPVKMILRKEDEYQALLQRAKLELMAFQKRYSQIVELESIFREIEKAL